MKRLFLFFILFLISGCNTITFENSKLTAENFVKNSETFKFDGIQETLKYTGFENLQCDTCWKYRFEYDSSQSGYGNRDRQMLAQVITHHVIEVSIENNKITNAVNDNKWDETNNKEVK